MRENRTLPMNHTTLFYVPAPRRWTAASVGADRYRAAIGPLSPRIFVFFIKFVLSVIFIHSCALVVHYAI